MNNQKTGQLTWQARGNLWLRLGLRLMLALLGLLLLRNFGGWVLSLLAPFLLALCVSAALDPPVRWLQRRLHWSRGLSALLLMLVILGLTFFVPSIFTGIAFDSGGVASGPMTATFLLPFAMGACAAVGGDLMTDAFGIVAMVAMTPLVTIQVMGLSSQISHKLALRRQRVRLERVEDNVVYFDL